MELVASVNVKCDIIISISRIYVYFVRFYGRIAEGPNNFDEKTIQAIRDNIAGLQKISGERIWTELKKILQGNFRIDMLVKIIECGAGQYIGNSFIHFPFVSLLKFD